MFGIGRREQRRLRFSGSAYWLVAGALVCLGESGCSTENPPEEVTPETGLVFDASKSAARNWNEVLLSAIRTDFARPTVHARNLFHSSALMYDAWAVWDQVAAPYFLGTPACPFTPTQRAQMAALATDDGARKTARTTALSYGMYRLLSHRFAFSPGRNFSQALFDLLMQEMDMDLGFSSRDFSENVSGNGPTGLKPQAAALGLYLADCIVAYGLSDGSNESAAYANTFYQPVNASTAPDAPGLRAIDQVDPDRWQQLRLAVAIDQSGNPVNGLQPFLSAEWGKVLPFALPPASCAVKSRDGQDWSLCHDPGLPAKLRGPTADPAAYQWNHALVVTWSAHLDPGDGVMWDISPASVGNVASAPDASDLPIDQLGLQGFYDVGNGGTRGAGHPVNPVTGMPYAPNLVPRGDYARVLAEFWADGPDSETPPGHWFTIYNHAVADHPMTDRRYQGAGQPLTPLEWDVKAYFALGGAVHDAAIAAWGAKGYYDSSRPITAIRFMAEKGQSSDVGAPNYHPEGIPLVPNVIETIAPGDPWQGSQTNTSAKSKFALGAVPGVSSTLRLTWQGSVGFWPRTGGRTSGPPLSPHPLRAMCPGTRPIHGPPPRCSPL